MLGAQVGRMMPVPSQAFFHFRCVALYPMINRGVANIDAPFSEHFLKFAVADAVFTIPANSPEDDFTLKMPTFEWGPTLLLQPKWCFSLSSQDFCNSADLTHKVEVLTVACCRKIFSEKVSGTKDECLDYLREGDTLVVTRIDRYQEALTTSRI